MRVYKHVVLSQSCSPRSNLIGRGKPQWVEPKQKKKLSTEFITVPAIEQDIFLHHASCLDYCLAFHIKYTAYFEFNAHSLMNTLHIPAQNSILLLFK